MQTIEPDPENAHVVRPLLAVTQKERPTQGCHPDAPAAQKSPRTRTTFIRGQPRTQIRLTDK